MRIDIVTIFPEYFGPLRVSLIGKAAERGDIAFAVHDLRAFTHDVHHTVDDTPYGGGPGMVMKPEPWGEALDALLPPAQATEGQALIVPSPSGTLFTQDMAARYARLDRLVFACGRYEGIDARVMEEAGTRIRVDEVSIGDYVLAGGEAAALVMIEAVCRLLPGVLGNAESAADDSFGGGGDGGMAGLLEGPLYTRPRIWRGREVPPVLLSGDHGAIARWRRERAVSRTAASRPDLAARSTTPDTSDADMSLPTIGRAPLGAHRRCRHVPDEQRDRERGRHDGQHHHLGGARLLARHPPSVFLFAARMWHTEPDSRARAAAAACPHAQLAMRNHSHGQRDRRP